VVVFPSEPIGKAKYKRADGSHYSLRGTRDESDRAEFLHEFSILSVIKIRPNKITDDGGSLTHVVRPTINSLVCDNTMQFLIYCLHLFRYRDTLICT